MHDPRAGRVSGHPELRAFVKRNQDSLAEHQARIETIASTRVDGRAVVELPALVSQGREMIDWPVALVAEFPDDRSVVFRTCCSQWPVDGRRHVRSPLLQPREIGLPAVVSHFLDALAAGDVEDAPSTFNPTGYFRESLPTKLAVHHGAAELRSFFTQQFGAGGGIALRTRLVTDDGVRCAVEFNCARWGTHVLPPQAGIFVHERDADGLLAAVRTYDDIESPAHPRPAGTSGAVASVTPLRRRSRNGQAFGRLSTVSDHVCRPATPPQDPADPLPFHRTARLLRQADPFRLGPGRPRAWPGPHPVESGSPHHVAAA